MAKYHFKKRQRTMTESKIIKLHIHTAKRFGSLQKELQNEYIKANSKKCNFLN